MKPPLFKLGDHVRSVHPNIDKTRGRIIASEWMATTERYLYTLRLDREVAGPYTPIYVLETTITWIDGLETILGLL